MTQPLSAPGPGNRQLEDLSLAATNGAGVPVIGYVSVPGDPAANGSDPSQRAIELACQRAGWQLIDMLREIGHGGVARRPALSAALERIADGEARGLVVSHARPLGDSIVDLAALISWFRTRRATFVALDLGLDTSTTQGTRVAMALIRLGGWHRGGAVNGARNGKAELRTGNGSHAAAGRANLLRRLSTMEGDLTLQEMADQLNAEGVPTLNGSDTWWPSSVRTALRYARARRATPADVPMIDHRGRS